MTLAIPNFSGVRVVVAGDVMLDEYWFGDTGRISPEAPVPVVQINGSEERPGGAANVALNLASVGVDTQLLGVVGDDARAERLVCLLTERGIACEFLSAPGLPTIHKLRVLARSQQLIRLDAERPLAGASKGLGGQVSASLAGAGALVLSDYGKGTLTDVGAIIAAADKAGVPCLVDPKGRDFSRYRGATLVTPTRSLTSWAQTRVPTPSKEQCCVVASRNMLPMFADWVLPFDLSAADLHTTSRCGHRRATIAPAPRLWLLVRRRSQG